MKKEERPYTKKGLIVDGKSKSITILTGILTVECVKSVLSIPANEPYRVIDMGRG